MGVVEQYLLKLKTEKRRMQRASTILTVLSVFVAFAVTWSLRMTGITIANGAMCGHTEHQHDETCLMEQVLICTVSSEYKKIEEAQLEIPLENSETDERDLVEDNSIDEATDSLGNEAFEILEENQHEHTNECYQIVYQCNMEEHIHILSCYADETKDLETAVIWESGLPELTGEWANDLVNVAQSQIGMKESERNFIVSDDSVKKGITRYGQWYGNPYGDWSSMFTLFCLNYAEIPQEIIPWNSGVYNMMRLAEDAKIVQVPDSNVGKIGNLLFLDTDENTKADRIAVVASVEEENMIAIGGDLEDAVTELSVDLGDNRIIGYINIEQLQRIWEQTQWEEDEVITDSIENDENSTLDESLNGGVITDKPIITLDVQYTTEGMLNIIAEVSNVQEEIYFWQWQYSEDGNEPWTDIEGAASLICELENTEENAYRYYRLQGRKAVVQPRIATFALERNISEEIEEEEIITSEAISPFSISKNSKTYTIDVYALPVDENGNRIAEIAVTKLESFNVTYVNNNNKGTTVVEDKFDSNLGVYHSAYLGTATTPSVNNIYSVWCQSYYDRGTKYALAYQQADGTKNEKWLTNTSNNTSLYLRYNPDCTVIFESAGFESLSEKVDYKGYPTLTEPVWTKEGYKIIGWTIGTDQQNVYTYQQILQMPVTKDVTYIAKWAADVSVSFNVGEYVQELEPIKSMMVGYGGTIDSLPTPTWKNNTVAMAFDGWYLDQDFSNPVTSEHNFYEDTVLYAKWSPKDEGYYVYFMDFKREGHIPLVLVTYSITEGQTISPYTPGNAPNGKEWNGIWYLDENLTQPYNFSIPVSQMTDYLTGAYSRDLYLYPGTHDVCRAIFVTYGTKVDPITVSVGGTVNLDQHIPTRAGYEFDTWTLKDGTPVSGNYVLNETTTFYAKWKAGYVPFEAILRIENANDTGMTQADILGTWYAKAGSQIRVKSTYKNSGDSRTGTHEVVCVIDGVEYPVYKNSGLTQKATLSDVYSTYFIYNNTGTNWTDEVNWDDVFTGGELPYSTRPISSAGDTIINFDYMRVRNDIVFTIPNTNSGGYIDIYKLQNNGLITGSVTYTGTKPTKEGSNVSAKGVSAENISWSYTAASRVGTSYNNYYTLHDMKYGQRIFEVYPVGGSWLTARNQGYHQYKCGSGQLFSSRRQDLTADFFQGTGRGLKPYSLTVEFEDQQYIALMYAIECLEGEEADFTLNGTKYKVDNELLEVVKHTGDYSIKDLDGCEPGISANGTYKSGQNTYNKYYSAKITSNTTSATVMKNAKVGDTSVYTLFAEKYWPYYSKFNGVSSVTTFTRAYIFYYDRLHMNIQFNFGYDSTGDGVNEIQVYEEIAYGERIDEYQYGMPDYQQHQLLNREGYEFAGWLDANGFVMETEDWESLVATGDSENNTMIFIAKWEKISNNIVEYYEDRSSEKPFESHYFDDGELVQYPTMTVYPEGWVWQEYGEGTYDRFDWDVPMYGEYGVQEVREINGVEKVVNVIRIYGTWDESHTRVVYDPNAPQGGIIGTAPIDSNEYTIWQSEVPVASKGNTANTDPEMIFVGWKLDRNGVVYHPGDHVPVQWPRTMIFTAQWAKSEDVVYLRYDPNGGSPVDIYPNDQGTPYKKNAVASVWDNFSLGNDEMWFTREGYTFTGWNTEPDGSGTAYAPNSNITLVKQVTTLYAQWKKDTYRFSLYKEDSDTLRALKGAEFSIYKLEEDDYLLVDTFKTGLDGHAELMGLEIDTMYKLVETKPPDGYAVITKDVYFNVKPNGSALTLFFYDMAGNQVSTVNGVTGRYIAVSQLVTVTVQNLRGYLLPSTGGMGIHLYILCGLILIFAPLVYGLSLRRKYERRSRK